MLDIFHTEPGFGMTIAMATMYDRTLGMFFYNISKARGYEFAS